MRIAIDLTPVLPGGTNGGAKIMTLHLIKELAKIAPENKYLLLVSKKNIAELSTLKTSNIDIIRTFVPRMNIHNTSRLLVALLMWPFVQMAKKIFPLSISARLLHKYHQFRSNSAAKNLSLSIDADLLFCPFTAPFYHELNIPVISVIYDLQSHYHPHFFTSAERYERRKNFESACYRASKLVCISDFVKETVLENSQVARENVTTIYIRLGNRLINTEEKKSTLILNRYHLINNNYLLFPANFWEHKNHQLLFTAFNIYRHKNPQTKLKLVCTGAENAYKHFLQAAVKEMGLEEHIIMPGYLSNQDFAELLANCRAIIYPSLYEGFGMPLLEAMALGKPVLCSNVASMPEVAGSAALQFDPRKPTEIADAIYRLESENNLASTLIQRGFERLIEFGTETDMAREYLSVFRETLQLHA